MLTLFAIEHDNYFGDITEKCLTGLYFRNIFPIGGLESLRSRGYQNNCYQIVKRHLHVKIKKEAKLSSLKEISRKKNATKL